MKVKIGCDIVRLRRFKKILERTPEMRSRIFLPQELTGSSTLHLAGIFAAKEAVTKALGMKAGMWQKIEIMHQKNGKPNLNLKGSARSKGYTHDLSIAHDGDYVIAWVCFIKKD